MRRLLVALLIFAACLFVEPAIASAQNVLDLGATGDFVNLDCCAQIAEDPTAARTLEQAKALEYAPFAMATLAHRQSAYWIRLRYRSETTQPWVLTAGYRPRSVTYYVDGDPAVRSGGDVPYEQRPVRAFNWIVFDVPPESTTHDVYLRVQSDEPLINLVAYSRDRFRTEYTRDIVVVTALLAILCALALSSVVLYFVMRDTLYLYYAAYIVLQALYRANDFGLLQAYVLPHLRFPYVQTEIVFDGLTLIAATLFIRRFLRSHAHSRLLDRANVVIAAIGGLYAVLALCGVPLRYTLVQNFSFVYVPVWMLTGIACWRRGYTPARLFLFAWTAYMVGIVVEAAVDAGMVTGLGIVRESSLDVALDYLVYLGIAVESVLLSLSLAEAYRSATNDKIDHLHALIQMSAQTEAMANLAYSDGLTNLPNRVAFMERVDEALLAAKRHGREAALLYVDVNNFKRINDTHGHAAGDAVLIEAAQRLRRGARGNEMVGRIAGDEFAVFLPSIETRTDAERLRERLCGAFDVPCRLGELELDVRVSIGIAHFPHPCATREELFAAADAAMYAVKRA